MQNSIKHLVDTIAKLRDPDGGCPWDLEQNFETLRTYMIEEAYEASEAMGEAESDKGSKGSTAHLQDELGDVLLQVVLNAQIASERGLFSFDDVAKSLTAKMIRRHPHVFSDKKIDGIDELYKQWDEIKQEENSQSKSQPNSQSNSEQNTKGGGKPTKLEQKYAKLPRISPPSKQAVKIGKFTKKIGFDWGSPAEVIKKAEEEIAELKEAMQKNKGDSDQKVREELGDVYFTLHQLCRHLDLDPEVVSQDANQKFLKRFDHMIQGCGGSINQFSTKNPEAKETLWAEAKLETT